MGEYFVKKRYIASLVTGGLLAASMMTAMVTATFAQETSSNDIVGTWVSDVAATADGVAPFQSMVTFNEGGTISEVSNELGLGLQGPAHGAWAETDDGYVATMQTWVFNADSGAAEGRVQIRMTIDMDGPDHMTAQTSIDFIDPTGVIEPDIDAGPFEATRMEVVGA
jgi:hypothetical protein